MATESYEESSSLDELVNRLNSEASDFMNVSAQEYLSNLNDYLANLSLVTSRRRPSDQIPLDTSAGIIWIIIIPVLYFLSVALILGILLGFFWYTDKVGIVVDGSEICSASSTASNVRQENVVEAGETDGVPGAFIRNYLSTAIEHEALSRASVTTKGSVRSLGVLTDIDHTLQSGARASLRGRLGLTEFSRGLSRSTPGGHAYPGDALSRDASASFRDVSSGSQRLGISVRSQSLHRTITTMTPTTGSKSASTESLEDNVSKESLRASMESHKLVWMSDGEIQPDVLYDNTTGAAVKPDQDQVQGENSKDPKMVTESTSSKLQHVFDNPAFTAEHAYLQEMDEHLRNMYETAVDMNSSHAESTEDYRKAHSHGYSLTSSDPGGKPSSTSNSSSMPRSLLLGMQLSGSSSQSDISPHDTRRHIRQIPRLSGPVANTRKPVGRRLFTANTGTNVQEILLPLNHNSEDLSNDHLHQMNSYRNGSESTKVEISSQLKSLTISDDADVEDYQISRANKLSDPPQEQLLDVDVAELDISSASRMVTTSSGELELSADSLGSAYADPDESSADGAPVSLPSSIARFHASKAGAYPSPVAGYPLPNRQNYTSGTTTDLMSDASQLDSQDDDRSVDDMSLCPNVGSCSQSTAALSADLLSLENSFEASQDGGGCDGHEVEKSERVNFLPKVLKGQSSISETARKSEHKSGIDNSFLKRRHETLEEKEERSPLLHSEGDTDCSKRQPGGFMNCGRISVEQRLKEFGFIKAKGKNKYIVNPSPGKFARRAGSVNRMFTDSEDGLCTSYQSSFDRSSCRIEILTPDRLTQSERVRTRPAITPILTGSANSFCVPNNLRNVNQWQRRQQDQRSRDAILENYQQMTERNDGVIEIHNENPLGDNDSNNNRNFREDKATLGKTKEDMKVFADKTHEGVSAASQDGSDRSVRDGKSSGLFRYQLNDSAQNSDMYPTSGNGEYSDDVIFDWAVQHDKPANHSRLIPGIPERSVADESKDTGGFETKSAVPKTTTRKWIPSMIPVKTGGATNGNNKLPMLKQQSSRILSTGKLKLTRPKYFGESLRNRTTNSAVATEESSFYETSSDPAVNENIIEAGQPVRDESDNSTEATSGEPSGKKTVSSQAKQIRSKS